MHRAVLPTLIVLSLTTVATLAPAADAPGEAAAARATTLVVQVVPPDLTPTTFGLVHTRSGTRTGSVAQTTLGALVSVSDANARVVASATSSSADAAAHLTTGAVSLLAGLVVARSIAVQADGRAAGGTATSRTGGAIAGLMIGGVARTAASNAVFVLPGVATVTTLESVEALRGQTGRRVFITALHVRLTAARSGYPAGTELLVGYADAGAAAPRTSLSRVSARPVDGHDTAITEAPPPGGFTRSPPIDASARAGLLDDTYAFPVVGGASFADDFGGPRADTGFHQGIDLFAANGTPLVALHDGTLFKVGWNRLGGHRLWLDDGRGNLFYYAHLSGYAPLAHDGAVVHAGDVIGFMGDSGDARGTPFHLHLEIHPGGGWAVPPFEYVRRWQGHTAGIATGEEPAPRPTGVPDGSAVIEAASDISSASGLDHAAVLRAAAGGEVGPGASQPGVLLALAGETAPGFAGLR